MKKNANLLNLDDKNNYALFAKIPYGGVYEGFEEFGQFGDDSTWAFWLNWTGDNSSCIFWLRFDVADIREGDKKICLQEYNTWADAKPLVYYKDNTDEGCIELYARANAMRPGNVQLLSQSYNRNIIMIDRLTRTVKDGELTPALVLNSPTLTGIVIESYEGEPKNLDANGNVSWDIDVAKEGYTAIEVTGVDLNGFNCSINRFSVQNNHAYLTVYSSGQAIQNIVPKIFVAYTKNTIW